jgi:hypothetical protein
MAQPRPWLDEVTDSLAELGGVSSLQQIYDRIRARAIIDFAANKKWDSKVRDTLQTYSSDSQIYNKSRGIDLFYSVDGIGQGVWGLRSMVKPTPQAFDLDEPNSPLRVEQQIYRILRDTKLAREIKSSYQYQCQVCGETIRLPDGSLYAEGHHIKPLGHNGPDVKGNILCLCPNHHVLFDYGCMKIDVGNLRCHLHHQVSQEFVDYHNSVICKAKGRDG